MPYLRERRTRAEAIRREVEAHSQQTSLRDKLLTRLERETLSIATEGETVELAPDLTALRRELLDGTRVLSKLEIDPIR